MKSEFPLQFPLRWWQEFDDEDNSIWIAGGPYSEEEGGGSAFEYRIKQRLRADKIEWYEASDSELMKDETDPAVWGSLEEAQMKMQEWAEEIVAKCQPDNA